MKAEKVKTVPRPRARARVAITLVSSLGVGLIAFGFGRWAYLDIFWSLAMAVLVTVVFWFAARGFLERHL